MTNAELGAICTVIGGGLSAIGYILRLGISQITTAINTNSNTMLQFVASAARLEVKLDQAHAAAVAGKEKMVELVDELSDVHAAAPLPGDGWKTPPGGYPQQGGYSQHKRKGNKGA